MIKQQLIDSQLIDKEEIDNNNKQLMDKEYFIICEDRLKYYEKALSILKECEDNMLCLLER